MKDTYRYYRLRIPRLPTVFCFVTDNLRYSDNMSRKTDGILIPCVRPTKTARYLPDADVYSYSVHAFSVHRGSLRGVKKKPLVSSTVLDQ